MNNIVVREVIDSRRPIGWIARRHLATRLRGILDRKLRSSALIAWRAIVLAVAFGIDWRAFVVTLLIILVLANHAGVRDLVRGRVWESWEAAPGKSPRVLGWALATPHPLDRTTWRLDIVRHPFRSNRSGWAAALMPNVHGAADAQGAALLSIDKSDSSTLLQFGYVWATTPLRREPMLLKPVDCAATPSPELAGAPLKAAYQGVLAAPGDVNALAHLAESVIAEAPAVWAGMPSWGWDAYVLRRSAPSWLLARACAMCLDGYIEGMAAGRVDASTSSPELDRRLGTITSCLITTSEMLRTAIGCSAQALAAAGATPLQWAQDLAALELDALTLAGLIASGRLRSGVSLGVLDTQSADVVRQASLEVRDSARAVRRSTSFDGEAVTAWASAIAYDGLELCRYRLASVRLRRSIRRVTANSIRELTFLLPRTYKIDSKTGDQFSIERAWRTFLQGEPNPARLGTTLAPLSATRVKRIGAIRGAEGMRVKQFRRLLAELITNFLILVVIGLLAWAVAMIAIHPMLNGGGLINYFSQLLFGVDIVPRSAPRPPLSGLDLGINGELLRDGTIGLLAVVITAAVAVAVASPRESSIQAWSQDRAWQVFVVAVGYVASVGALVLAYSALATWGRHGDGLPGLEARAHAVSATLFALLSAAAAASMSAMQSRLDEWNQRRRLLVAEARLNRAHARLGPSPKPLRLVLDGLRCAAFCMAWMLVPFALLALTQPRSEWSYAQIALVAWYLTVLNLLPMIAITTVFIVRWVAAWGLAGRVAVTIGILSAFALLLMSIPMAVFVAYGVESPIDLVVSTYFVLPTFLLVAVLARARINSYKIQRDTGRGTFALHIALRIGLHNFAEAAD